MKSPFLQNLGEIVKKKVKEQPLEQTMKQACIVTAGLGQFSAMRQGQPYFYAELANNWIGTSPLGAIANPKKYFGTPSLPKMPDVQVPGLDPSWFPGSNIQDWLRGYF